MKRGSSFRFIEWPMPLILASVVGWLMVWSPGPRDDAGSLELAHFLGRVLHGSHDGHVAGPAAVLPGACLPDFPLTRDLGALPHCRAPHHRAPPAEPTLQPAPPGDAPPHGLQLAALREAFDGCDLHP